MLLPERKNNKVFPAEVHCCDKPSQITPSNPKYPIVMYVSHTPRRSFVSVETGKFCTVVPAWAVTFILKDAAALFTLPKKILHTDWPFGQTEASLKATKYDGLVAAPRVVRPLLAREAPEIDKRRRRRKK